MRERWTVLAAGQGTGAPVMRVAGRASPDARKVDGARGGALDGA
ncbi:hypothetical protein [Pyxidicoccus fallax]|nr:hypothetical protein [Pyxidicoccus fallax]